MESLGKHIIAELFECDHHLLDDVDFIEHAMVTSAEQSGATVINSSFHHFAPFGVSGVVVIQESHFAIHCWPEYAFASLDIYTCGNAVDPWKAYELMKGFLCAEHGTTIEMNRGQVHLLKKVRPSLQEARDSGTPGAIKRTRDVWFTERNQELALSIKHQGKKLYEHHSPFQKIEVFSTHAFGRMLVLDGIISCTEKDEYAYHEMMAHVPSLTHPAPKSILIIGGGDGGVLREVCRYPEVERITMVEIDANVIEVSKEFFPELASSFRDPRLEIRIENGTQFVTQVPDQSFDVILVDSNDPVGPGKSLFDSVFYEHLYTILADPGIVITQSQSPRFNQQVFIDLFEIYRKLFGVDKTHCFLVHMPSYPTGMWSFSYLVKGSSLDPIKGLNRKRLAALEEHHTLNYYNEAIHRASFALPNYVHRMIYP